MFFAMDADPRSDLSSSADVKSWTLAAWCGHSTSQASVDGSQSLCNTLTLLAEKRREVIENH